MFFPSIIQPPLGLAYIAAMIKGTHDVQVIDASAENLKFQDIFKRLDAFKPDVIGITSNISIAYISCELALRIKLHMRSVKIVMGGPWATSNANYIIKHKIANFVVLGEGEFVFKELLDKLERGESADTMQGLVLIGSDGSIKHNPKRDFINNLDDLPYPAWELFPPSQKYFNHYRHLPLYPMMITRGCPYGCIHCTKEVHGYKIRKRSVENVLGEIKHLIDKFKVREIIIVDDNFSFDVKYAEAILDAIYKAKLNIYLLMPNGLRADTLTPHLLKKMKRAGVYGFAIGVESGVQSIVKKIGKNLDLNKARYAAKIAREHGFLLRAFFILGLPYDSMKTMRQTIQFAKEINPHIAYFYIATLFPGTAMYEIVKNMGHVYENALGLLGCQNDRTERIYENVPGVMRDQDKNKDMSIDAGFFYKPVSKFSFGNLKPGDVAKAYKIAVREFYMRPCKIIDVLSTIKSLPELKWVMHYFIISIFNIFTRFSSDQ
ncbi:MAG: radical SAM protein [Candidatus Sigynarchaeota archaeon]